MDASAQNVWKKCSSCKKDILIGARYYVCSVSTCNGQRTGYVFCSVSCWEVHLPTARHKDAAAIEMKAVREPSRKIIPSTPASGPAQTQNYSQPQVGPGNREVLIIASRLKDYVQARADMNTSAGVMDVLSDFVRVACDRAIENARADGRKTVMERDFKKILW